MNAPESLRGLVSAATLPMVVCSYLALALVSGPAVALIGGELDRENRFAAVIQLRASAADGCTATKIAPLSLLTAAHCVVDRRTGALKATWRAGRTVSLYRAPDLDGPDDGPVEVVIDDVALPPDYQRGLAKFAAYKRSLMERDQTSSPDSAAVTQLSPRAGLPSVAHSLRIGHHFSTRFPDVAILQLRTDTPAIPVRPVDLRPAPAGAEVTLVGYGCRGLTGHRAGRRHRKPGRDSAVRNWGRTRIIRVDPVNLYTEATQRSPDAPSLCPGDSGGPVLYQGRIVAVHGAVYGLHARLGARSNMAASLAALADWPAWP